MLKDSKFLRVKEDIAKVKWNKYLLRPFRAGEIVKVAPIEEQIPTSKDMTIQMFRRNYVVVYRKDDEGKWTERYVNGWSIFEELSKKVSK